MTTITITLPDERLAKLQQIASDLHTSPEALVLAGIEELLSRPDDKVQNAIEYVIRKNAELYRRLA